MTRPLRGTGSAPSGTIATINALGATIPGDGSGLYPPVAPPPVFVPASDLISQLESGHGWTGSAGFVTSDTTDFITGIQSVNITTSSTGAFSIRSGTIAVDATAKQFRVRVKIDDITNVSSMNFWAGNDSSYTNAWKWFIEGTAGGSNAITSGGTTPQQGWVVIVLNFADAQQVGSPTRTGITNVKFDISRTASAGEVTLRVDEVDTVPEATTKFPNGAVVICFDDILVSSWSLAKPVLDTYRYRASHFVITDQVGGSGRVTADELRVLQDEGHEICCHAYTDADHGLSYTGMTGAQLDADMRAQKSWLRSNGFRGDGTAYPLGQYGLTTDGVPTHNIMRKYFSFARTTANGTNKPGATFPLGDPYRVPALSSITTFSGGFTPTTLLGAGVGSLDAVKAAHGVKVLCFHKVIADASTPAALTEIRVADFTSIIAGISARGMAVLTMGEFVATRGAAAVYDGDIATGAAIAQSKISGLTAALAAKPDLSTVTTKGDLYVATGSAAVARQAAGTNGQLLMADSNAANGVKYASVSGIAGFTALDRGFFGWNGDPSIIQGGSALSGQVAAGVLAVVRIRVPIACTITNLHFYLTSAGATLTANQCLAALFTSAGTWVKTTVNQATLWAGSTGLQTMALTSTYAAAAGDFYVGAWFNGTTAPTFARLTVAAAGITNMGTVAPNLMAASTTDTGLTTAAPGSLGTQAAIAAQYWAAVS